MEAHEAAFAFMNGAIRVEIPFFQRGYVWNKDNWRDLIEDLLDDKSSHFLGSIILKSIKTASGEIPRWSLIDGQQRLTTLSVLLRACYDNLPLDTYDEETQQSVRFQMQELLFYKEKSIFGKRYAKISHSRVDAPSFGKVIEGKMVDKLDSIVMAEEATKDRAASPGILQCYKYYCSYLDKDEEKTVKLWELLQNQNAKILVKIDLDADENEQAIFDTVNSAGVRLTCADTIKNTIFQYAIDKVSDSPCDVTIGEDTVTIATRDDVINFYKTVWESAFSADSDTIAYWSTLRPLGRITRDNLEILLHCVALIRGIYNPDTHKISDLPDVYREYTRNLSSAELFDFIKNISNYATTYRKYFCTFDSSTLFSYKKPIQRLFHVFDILDISTFHAYVLKLLSEYEIADDENIPKALADEFTNLESIAIRFVICGSSTKNFNKNCADLIAKKTTTSDLLKERDAEVNDIVFTEKLKSISNKHATLLLFWLELKRRNADKNVKEDELKYCYTLEHIMPQKWQEFWPVTNPKVLDVQAKPVPTEITDKELAEDVRARAIYEIGNMALLVSSLNTSIRNYDFKRKMEGEGRKKGVKRYDYLLYTKDITTLFDAGTQWDESEIRKRTEAITKEIIAIW